jgi:hypothetical protein
MGGNIGKVDQEGSVNMGVTMVEGEQMYWREVWTNSM